jgi:hypothetical protein
MNDWEFNGCDGSEASEEEVARPNASPRAVPLPTHPAHIAPGPGDMLKAYQRALEQLSERRGTMLDEGGYASEVREKAFWSFYKALTNACVQIVYDAYPESEYTKHNRPRGDPRTMHVVASAPGSGKSTLAKAFAIALTRVNERRPYPLGCVFLVHHIATAEAVFRELSKLLPNAVAVFTTKHDADNAQSSQSYSTTFRVGDLEKYPVIVVTHEFYMGIRGDYARNYLKRGLKFPRVVTFIDERANEIAVHDLDLLAIERVLKHVQQDNYAPQELRDSLLALSQFLHGKRTGDLSIETLADDKDRWEAAIQASGYLRSEDAARYARKASALNPRLAFDAVIGFADAMIEDRAFIARANKGKNAANFVGYERALPRVPGMVLLDATADIDGISKVCAWRKHAETPPERYDRLEIIHVPSVVKGTIRRWLREPGNLQAYADHIRDLILRYAEAGQNVLVVCAKDVAWAENIDDWSDHMVPFLKRTGPRASIGDPEDTEFTKGFAWPFEGRQVVVTWFGGYGIGANVWRDADVVIVCDDFHLPNRTIRATLLGLKERKASKGLRGASEEEWNDELEYLRDGHILRWMKQMALRGKSRDMDESGVCGAQRLVITGDLIRLLAHRPKVFPGAKPKSERPIAYGQRLDRLVAILMSFDDVAEVSTKEIEEKLNVRWSDVSTNLKKQKGYQEVLEAIGWSYERGRGPKRSCFRRTDPGGQSLAQSYLSRLTRPSQSVSCFGFPLVMTTPTWGHHFSLHQWVCPLSSALASPLKAVDDLRGLSKLRGPSKPMDLDRPQRGHVLASTRASLRFLRFGWVGGSALAHSWHTWLSIGPSRTSGTNGYRGTPYAAIAISAAPIKRTGSRSPCAADLRIPSASIVRLVLARCSGRREAHA